MVWFAVATAAAVGTTKAPEHDARGRRRGLSDVNISYGRRKTGGGVSARRRPENQCTVCEPQLGGCRQKSPAAVSDRSVTAGFEVRREQKTGRGNPVAEAAVELVHQENPPGRPARVPVGVTNASGALSLTAMRRPAQQLSGQFPGGGPLSGQKPCVAVGRVSRDPPLRADGARRRDGADQQHRHAVQADLARRVCHG